MVQIGMIWIATAAGIAVMKKIEPHNWLYPVYAVLVAALFTISAYLS